MSPLNPDEASALVGRDILVCWGLHGTRRGYIYNAISITKAIIGCRMLRW